MVSVMDCILHDVDFMRDCVALYDSWLGRHPGYKPKEQRGTCRECGEPHHAKGYCKTHFMREYNRRKKEAKCPTP